MVSTVLLCRTGTVPILLLNTSVQTESGTCILYEQLPFRWSRFRNIIVFRCTKFHFTVVPQCLVLDAWSSSSTSNPTGRITWWLCFPACSAPVLITTFTVSVPIFFCSLHAHLPRPRQGCQLDDLPVWTGVGQRRSSTAGPRERSVRGC
jgi:hypothetical protein